MIFTESNFESLKHMPSSICACQVESKPKWVQPKQAKSRLACLREKLRELELASYKLTVHHSSWLDLAAQTNW